MSLVLLLGQVRGTPLRALKLWLTRLVEGTPYAGGYFRVKFRFTEEFPAAPPKCTFQPQKGFLGV